MATKGSESPRETRKAPRRAQRGPPSIQTKSFLLHLQNYLMGPSLGSTWTPLATSQIDALRLPKMGTRKPPEENQKVF